MAAAVASFPTPVPSLESINTELANYANLLQTSASRDKVQVQLKNISKFTLTQMLSQLADYVNTTSTDSAILASSGFELNKLPQPITITAPENPTLYDGSGSGQMVLKFKAVKGASSYVFQYTSDATMEENSWISNPATTTSYTFTGLTKGTTYYCRALAVGANQQVTTSIVLNRISQ
ncbi:MAG: fibronectin type III domain-containing protein [Bacteroidota bacterium]|nr:fibronectin type III domain-containing protein [Bacteroidota bacterium]